MIVPTYNERDSIPEAAARLFAAAEGRVDLLVVDDGSPDGTAAVVEQIAQGRDDVHLIKRSGKLGLGTAYVTGFKWGIERGYWALVEMDADLSHDPADVPRLLDALDEGDLAIGSRYVPGGGVGNWGRLRRALSGAGNVYARAWLGYDVRDSTSGFRAYRAEVLETENLGAMRSEGYAFQIEMTRRLHLRSGRVVEIPITFVERARGNSKMSRRVVLEAILRVTRWGVADRFGRSEKAQP